MKIPFSDIRVKGFAFGFAVLAFLCAAALSIIFNGNLADLIAAVGDTLHSTPAFVYLQSTDGTNTLTVGQTKTIDFDLDARVPVNSVGATIDYAPDSLDVVALSKERSFIDLWTQDTTIREGTGEISFSGGTTRHGGVTGTSTVLTITVRAKQVGTTTLSVGHVEVYAADGKGTVLDTEDRPISLTIAPAAPIATNTSGGGTTGNVATPPATPDINGDGKVNIVDASIMMVALKAPYDARYDLNNDGKVGLDDLSILFFSMNK